MWGGGSPISRRHSVIDSPLYIVTQYNEAQSRKTNPCRKYIIAKQKQKTKNLDPEIGQGSQCSHVGLQHSVMT